MWQSLRDLFHPKPVTTPQGILLNQKKNIGPNQWAFSLDDQNQVVLLPRKWLLFRGKTSSGKTATIKTALFLWEKIVWSNVIIHGSQFDYQVYQERGSKIVSKAEEFKDLLSQVMKKRRFKSLFYKESERLILVIENLDQLLKDPGFFRLYNQVLKDPLICVLATSLNSLEGPFLSFSLESRVKTGLEFNYTFWAFNEERKLIKLVGFYDEDIRYRLK